ncbi:hypothetical protein C3E77_02115 [Mycetocola zhujimingii]|nr:hypothetical protein C3E77_02115 [Mycetocola zhujimingii]
MAVPERRWSHSAGAPGSINGEQQMSDTPNASASRTMQELSTGLPDPLTIPDARRRIREAYESGNRWVIVLDDDPTGSQTVHDTPVLTSWDADDLEWAFDQPGHGFFILTNSRGFNDDEARERVSEVARAVEREARKRGAEVALIARGDSTLRGHYPLETDVLITQAATAGMPFSALLLAPAYFPAGRVTVGDVHYVGTGDTFVPVGLSNYAKDATFGFSASTLPDYIEEKTGGAIPATDVISIGLEDIRQGGPERVRDILLGCTDAQPVAVNLLEEADLDVVVLGLLLAEEQGARVLTRCGPSFPGARLGIAAREPLTHDEIFAGGERPGHGLVVVGSHVELTTRQIAHLHAEVTDIETVVVDVPRLLDPAGSGPELARVGEALISALGRTDVVLASSREQITGDSGHSSLVIAQTVSAVLVALTEIAVSDATPAWVIAKGGITSSDVATGGLKIRRAMVAGQLFPGIVSVWLHVGEDNPALSGLPYVVFAGNVGADDTLAEAVKILRGDARA